MRFVYMKGTMSISDVFPGTKVFVQESAYAVSDHAIPPTLVDR